jgi:energy-coupling factor transporter ATP-binding protein EcfA2
MHALPSSYVRALHLIVFMMSFAYNSSLSFNTHRIVLAQVSKSFQVNAFQRSFLPPGARPEKALANISLEILPNTRYTLVGVSGSGKTTLLEVLSGGMPISAGFISLEGCQPLLLDSRKFSALLDDISKAGTLACALGRVQGLAAQPLTRKSLLEDLLDERDRDVEWNNMSPWLRVASAVVLAIARATGLASSSSAALSSSLPDSGQSLRAPLLLFDEVLDGHSGTPSSWATSEHRSACDTVLRRAGGIYGCSAVYATHSDEWASLADEVLLFSAGELKPY